MYSIKDTKIPLSIKIIALWCYLFGILCTIGFSMSIYYMIEGTPEYLLTLTSLILSALNYVAGRGLWKGKNWGRIIAVITHGYMVLVTIIAMSTRYIYFATFPWAYTYKSYFWRIDLSNIIQFVLFGTIIIYLLSNKVSRFFGRYADNNSST